MKRLLIAGGCSYTHEGYISIDNTTLNNKGPWTMWPKYFGDKLGLETVNTGNSGISNQTIFHRVMEAILTHKDDVDTVAVLWTEFDRSRFYGIFDWMPISEVYIHLKYNLDSGNNESKNIKKSLDLDDSMIKFFKSKYFWEVKERFIKACINDSLQCIFTLAEYCKSNGIKYIFAQGLGPLQWPRMNSFIDKLLDESVKRNKLKTDINEYVNLYINNIWFSNLDNSHKKNIIGWPLDRWINGYTIDDLRYKGQRPFYKKSNNWNVSQFDTHPDSDSQYLISQIFYKRWKKIYG